MILPVDYRARECQCTGWVHGGVSRLATGAEQWAYNRIMQELGGITYYVNSRQPDRMPLSRTFAWLS